MPATRRKQSSGLARSASGDHDDDVGWAPFDRHARATGGRIRSPSLGSGSLAAAHRTAAMTGLRHADREVTRSKDAEGQSVYGWLGQRPSAGDSNGSATHASKEALSRPPKLDIRELREEGCRLYGRCFPTSQPRAADPSGRRPNARSALGGLRPKPHRQLPRSQRS